MYPEPSTNDHLAPWNWDDENDCCACDQCNAARRRAAREERDIDEWEYRRYRP